MTLIFDFVLVSLCKPAIRTAELRIKLHRDNRRGFLLTDYARYLLSGAFVSTFGHDNRATPQVSTCFQPQKEVPWVIILALESK